MEEKNLYVIDSGNRLYGPFKTPESAVKWAEKQFLGGIWKLMRLWEAG